MIEELIFVLCTIKDINKILIATESKEIID